MHKTLITITANQTCSMTSKPEIFFSYAWGDKKEKGKSREKIVLELYDVLKKYGYEVAIDKEDLGYTGYISEFMENIGQGKAVVVAMTPKYAHSPYCMFELYEIARNCKFNKQEFGQKVLPIMVEFVDFAKPAVLKEYFDHWEKELQEWEALTKTYSRQMTDAQFVRYGKIKLVHQHFGMLVDWLVDMNSKSVKLLAANEFALIRQQLDERLATGEKPATIPPQKTETDDVPHALTASPFRSPVFLGREAELATIEKQLTENPKPLLLVNGMGGIGKTSLAAEYYYHHKKEYRHVAWLLSEGSITDALLELAEPLGLTFEAEEAKEKRLEKLLLLLENEPGPSLLVIDNANEEEDLKSSFATLSRLSHFKILLTTRITKEPKGAQIYNVSKLPYEKALQLFTEHYPGHQSADEALFKQVYNAVEGNTLIIELLAKNLDVLQATHSGYCLAELVADLNQGVLKVTQTKPVETAYHSNVVFTKNPMDIIAAMYDIGELAPAEKRLLSILAVLPAESILFTTLQTLLPTTADLGEILHGLGRKGWIAHDQQAAAYKISPVIQEITWAKNIDLLGDCEELIKTLVYKLNYDTNTGHFLNASYQEAMVYARYSESICTSIKNMNYNISVLLNRIGRYYRTTGNLPKALRAYDSAIKCSIKLCETYPDSLNYKNGLAIDHCMLGNIYYDIGNLAKALKYYEDYARLTEKLHNDYPQETEYKNNLAIAYEKLGQTYADMGNLPKALQFYELDAGLSKQLFDDYPYNVRFKNGLAIAYSKLGETYASMGNLPKALQFYEDYNKLAKQLFDGYPDNVGFKNGLAIAYSKLGETYASMGNLPKALQFYEDYNKLKEELYNDYPDNVGFKNGLAISYYKLGTAYKAHGDMALKKQYFQQAQALWQQLAADFPDYAEFGRNLGIVNDLLEQG